MEETHNMAIRHSSATPEHFTPPEVIEAAARVLGTIDLDPASTALANRYMVKASKYYNARTNGFDKKWEGTVFLNPPGGRCDEKGRLTSRGKNSAAKLWWFNLVNQYQNGGVTAAIFIGFSIEILQTTQAHDGTTLPCPLDFPICIPQKRIRFWTETGNRKSPFVESKSPSHANVIVYLPPEGYGRNHKQAFMRQFGQFGRCIWQGRQR